MKIGDEVEWSSQAGGFETTKRGVVKAVIPPKEVPRVFAFDVEPDVGKWMFDGRPRWEESYLVLVTGSRGSRKLYWPRVKHLRLVSDE